MADREQIWRDAPTGIVAELREWKRRALEAEYSLVQAERERDAWKERYELLLGEARKVNRAWKEQLDRAEQAERERDEARKYHAEDSRAWKKRCDVAEARLAKVPALVEALKRASAYVEEWWATQVPDDRMDADRLAIREALSVWEQE